MQNISVVSVENPFVDLVSPLDVELTKRNALCQRVALAVMGMGAFAALGASFIARRAATFSAFPVVVASLGVITTILAYKTFTLILNINRPLDGLPLGWGRLHQSAAKGQVMRTKGLLALGANPNAKSGNGDTPLHMACFKADKPNSQAHIQVMDLLVKSGAFINAAGNSGRCPLHYAIDARHIDRVEFLVDQGAYINLKQSCRPSYSPWEYAQNRQSLSQINQQLCGDPRSDQALLEADRRIYQIFQERGSVYSPNQTHDQRVSSREGGGLQA